MKIKGYFDQQYTVSIEADTKTLLFSGQGTNYQGMFNEYKDHPTFIKYFAIADAFCKQIGTDPASTALKKNHDAELTPMTMNLCLFTAQCALGNILTRTFTIDELTAHSFGEYAMLVTAGCLSFEEGLKVVYVREAWSAEPNSIGTLVALSCDIDAIKGLNLPEHHVAIKNSSQQTVIAVVNPDSLGDLQVKHKILSLPQPYHTTLMDDVAQKMQLFIEQQNPTINPPKIQFISSVTSNLIDANNYSEDIIQSIIIGQVNKPIDFIAQVEHIKNTDVIEVGSKPLFSPIIGASDDKKTVVFYSQLLPKVRHKQTGPQSALAKVVNSVIAKITGYEISSISIEDKFEEDLGIDSIKKAEIVFQVLQETQTDAVEEVNLSSFQKLQDLVSYVERNTGAAKKQTAPWKVYAIGWQKQSVILKDEKAKFSYCTIDKIGSCKDTHVALSVPEAYAQEQVVHLTQELNNLQAKNIILLSKVDSNIGRAYMALFKSYQKEQIDSFNVKHIETNTLLQDDVLAMEFSDPCSYIRYEDNVRYVRSFTPSHVTPLQTKQLSVLCIGGAKGISHSLLTRLAKDYQLDVTIIGRSAEDEIKDQLDMFETCTYIKADASTDKWTEQLVDQTFDVAINAAGYQVSQNNANKNVEDKQKELQAKIETTKQLYKIKANKYILFGSVVGTFGNAGQLTYAFGNAYLGGKDTLVINWPPWDSVGMTADAVGKILSMQGISVLDEETAYYKFRELLNATGHYVILPYTDIVKYMYPQGRQDQPFALDNSLFEGHKMQNKYLLPTAFALDTFCKSTIEDLGFLPTLNNVQLYKPLQWTGSQQISLKRSTKGGKYAMQLVDSSPIVSASLSDTLLVSPLPEMPQCPKPMQPYTYKELFHTGNYRVIEDHYIGDKQAWATVKGTSFMILLDSMWQLLGIAAYKNYSLRCLPSRIESMSVHYQECIDKSSIFIDNITQNDKKITADVYVFSNNECIIYAKGMEVKAHALLDN